MFNLIDRLKDIHFDEDFTFDFVRTFPDEFVDDVFNLFDVLWFIIRVL